MRKAGFQNKFLKLFVLFFIFASPFAVFAGEKVRLQLKWQHQFQFAGYYAAIEKGFYKDAGLDVELIANGPGQDSVQKVLDGKAEFGVGSTELLLNRQKGDPVVVLGVIFQHSPRGLLMLKNDELQSIHDLSGKKVMIENGTSEITAYLNKEGVPAEKFTLIPHSFHTEDLISGKVDAISVYVTNEVFEVEKARKEYVLFSPRSVGIDFYGDNLFTTEEQILRNPEMVRAFRDASFRGWKYAMSHPDEIIELIHSKYSKRHTVEHLKFEAKQMIALLRTDLLEPGHINPGRWEHIAKTYKDLGMMGDDFDFDAFLYNPNPPQKDLRWLYLTLGISLLIAFLVTLLALYIFRKNAQLRKEISDRKIAEDAMKEMQVIVHRTSKLDSLGILAGGIAHDFNNLFTGVFGYIEMAQRRSTDKKTAEYLSKAMRSLNQVRDLTSHLITFSKGGKPVKELAELFPFIEESAVFALSGTRVECTFDYPEDLWKCEYDKSQIGQVVENLMVNASQADPKGTVNVICKNVQVSGKEMHGLKNGKYVEILIKDSGPGMDPAIIDKVFDPFFSTKTGGHGLGLAISYSIVKQHSGSIELVSEKGKGATFQIHLPAHEESK